MKKTWIGLLFCLLATPGAQADWIIRGASVVDGERAIGIISIRAVLRAATQE